MKTYSYSILLTIFLLLSFSTHAVAQFTGGGQEEREERQAERSTANQTSLFDGEFIIKGGWANPAGMYGTLPSPNNSFTDMLSGESGFGAESGFTIGAYGMSSLGHAVNNIGGGSLRAELGLVYGLHYSQTTPNWGNISEIYTNASTPFHLVDFKIGPVLAISPVQNLVVDLFYNPMFSLGVPPEIDAQMDDFSQRFYVEEELAYGLRHGLGFNLRYSALLFSVETTFGDLNVEYTEHVSGGGSSGIFDYDTPINTSITMVTFGIIL
ncbi:hypothetical protein DYD21_13395 [Rhodohalobacter sp. SW132]|uniref:hypothetical protein n=1 Tax=Rhodohalobacter sp. SW132 TaxID=2293433 RepID=UPI000E24CD3D|nr:hypothetical protein [Rhodohalobacter sp. SW132]REL32816.1 hypothetical protein DYD21_13395 [Rhodohalobacter sp. SW132]